MRLKQIPATLAFAVALLAGVASTVTAAATAAPAAAEAYPLKQGLHQWTASGGKLMLVVGSYQDSTRFHRSYAFYFKTPNDEAWNQVALPSRQGGAQFTWNSATHGEYTLLDATVVQRPDGIYFVVADKPMTKGAGYADKRDASATWYKLTLSDDDHSDDPPYQFKQAFTRSYPKTPQEVEAILAREASLQPRQ